MKVKEREKAGLKLNIQKMKIMASGPITSRQIDGETMETVTDFIFLGSKITADDDCSHEIKTLAPGKKSYDKTRQCIKKQRHHFADKGPVYSNLGKAMASHSSTPAWKIPWIEEPGGLQSMGLSTVFSNPTFQNHQFFGTQLSLWSNCHIHT